MPRKNTTNTIKDPVEIRLSEELPNLNSRKQTPTSLLIDLHYQKLGLSYRWPWERFTALCRVLKLTPEELASLVLMPHYMIATYEKTGRLPGREGARRPIALILSMLEYTTCQHLTDDVIENPFPDLNNLRAK